MPSIDLKQDSNLDNNLIKIEINSFVESIDEKIEDSLGENQFNQENISSGSSINISNILVSSSSSCGNYMNVGSSSSSSLGNQDFINQTTPNNNNNNNLGSDLSSSSRRSSINGEMDTISKVQKVTKSNRKPKRMNMSKSRKTRRLIRPKLDDQDADIDDESDVFDSENENKNNNLQQKSAKFNCLDLDLFDYLLKRNFLKSINQNKSDIKILNSTVKQRKLSLFTTSSEFVNLNDFETNLNINEYFYQLIKNGETKKKFCLERKIDDYDDDDDAIKNEVNNLMNDLLDQVEKKQLGNEFTSTIIKSNEKSLIKTLLEDMSTLNYISSLADENKGETSSEELNRTETTTTTTNNNNNENLCLETTQQIECLGNSVVVENTKKTLVESNQKKTSSNPEIPGGIGLQNDLLFSEKKILDEILVRNEMDNLDKKLCREQDNVETILFKKEDLNTLSTQQQQQQQKNDENFEILEEVENEDLVKKINLNTNENSCCNKKHKNMSNFDEILSVDDLKTRSLSGDSSSSSVSSNSSYQSDSTSNSETNNNHIKKIVLKNNEIVLIEDCLDDDDEEEKQLKLLKSSNVNAQNLINDSTTLNKREPKPEMSKSQTFTLPRSTSSNRSNKDDDPYVKAALERFDAFCKSKSSHNLDQAGSNPTTPSFVTQKSPYLARKDPSSKESVTSFIKRRSTRVDPCAKNDTLVSRSVSETRTDKPSVPSSSLAKKFLGSLTPQLDPIEQTESLLNEIIETDKNNNSLNFVNKPSDLVLDKKSASPLTTNSTTPTRSKVNVIKLEVFNSKTRPKIETSNGVNKPPIPVQNPSLVKSKVKPQIESPKPIEIETKVLNTVNNVKNNNTATKPTSRIIPIEIKNSKTGSTPPTSKPTTPRQAAKSVERVINNITTANIDSNETIKPENQIPPSPSVQDRIRSLSTSYREPRDLNDRNLPLSFSRLREDLSNSMDTSENIYESAIKENPIKDSRPDPIVEKACSNFMTRLMEFQRLHVSQYQPYTTTTTPRTDIYTGPIVSARTTNPETPISNFKSYYTSSCTPTTYTSTYSPALTTSLYEPPTYSKSYLDSDSSSPRPYVSAIRKRRTLFSDGFDSASTECQSNFDFASSTSSFSSMNEPCLMTRSTVTLDDSKNTVRNRPLSIVNEESNVTNVGLNRSYTMNDTRLKTVEKETELNKQKSTLKKSNSITSAAKSEKIRSTVFDRLAVNTPETKSSITKTSSGTSINSKPPTVGYEIKKKEENDIAVVNSVVPKTRRESTTSISNNTQASTSNSALSRIRSLDSKTRDKYKSTTNLKTNPKPPTSTAPSSTNVPACYLYPCPDIKPSGILKSTSSIKSNSSTSETNETRRKSQNTLIKSPPNETTKNDVFERLSKRANSMKNLSAKTKTSSSSSSSSEDPDHKALGDDCEDNVFQTSALTAHNTHQNSSTSKTSVFERLYKSNIAAHMNNQESEIKNSSLKKNMSLSSANLIPNSSLSSQHVSKAKGTSTSRPKNYINTRLSLKTKKDDSEESNESKTSDSETNKLESPREHDQTKQVSSSFLSKKLMDLFDN